MYQKSHGSIPGGHKTNKNWVHFIILDHHEGRNRAHRMTITFLGG